MSDYRILNTQYTPRHPDTPLELNTLGHPDILLELNTPEHTNILLELATLGHPDILLELNTPEHTDILLELATLGHTDILPDTQDTLGHTDILLERRTATGSDYAMLRRVPASAQDQTDRFYGYSTATGNILNYDPEAAVPLDSCSELDALFGKEYELWIEKKEVYEQAVIQAVERARRRIVHLTGLNNDGVNQLFTEHSSLGKRVSRIIDAHVHKVPKPDTTTIDLDGVLAPVWNEEPDGNQ